MVYESPSPGRDALFKEAVFQYALYEPGLLEPEGVSKVFFTCDSHEQLLPLEQAINARWAIASTSVSLP